MPAPAQYTRARAQPEVRAPRYGVEERQIGDYTYRVTLLGASAGCRMAVRLAKLLAPSAANGLEGLTGSRSDGLGSLAVGIGECLRELTARITPDEFTSLAAELARNTTVAVDAEHEPTLSAIYDEHFAGHYDWLMAWFAFAMEANFRSFFAGTSGAYAAALVAQLAGLMERFGQVSASRQASSGTSTESPQAAATATA
jgi:hypothetical protein